MYKLFEVTLDNNPGEWKSGDDPKYLIVAESREESIEIFKNSSYGSEWLYDGDNGIKRYGIGENILIPSIRDGASIYSTEIKFSGFDIEFTNREIKIDKLLDNDNN